MKSFRIMTADCGDLHGVGRGCCCRSLVRTKLDQNSDAAAAAEATKKLGAFLGKWNTSATFASGEKATTELECRWSSQGNYLVCEQHVKLSAREQHQLTVYSYNLSDHSYQYATFSDPGHEADQRRGGDQRQCLDIQLKL